MPSDTSQVFLSHPPSVPQGLQDGKIFRRYNGGRANTTTINIYNCIISSPQTANHASHPANEQPSSVGIQRGIDR
eukprot:1345076-Amorphochlora_amoeboformis.AAC.1